MGRNADRGVKDFYRQEDSLNLGLSLMVDFVVPGDVDYSEFRANITTEAEVAELNVDMHLKYPDQTTDLVSNPGEVLIAPGEPLTLSAAVREELSPYQVNLRVGDTDSEGTTYTATVYGCR